MANITFEQLLKIANDEAQKTKRVVVNGSEYYETTPLFKKMEQVVLNTFNVDYYAGFLNKCYLGVDFDAFQNKILESKDPSKMYHFAYQVIGADIKEIDRAVIACKKIFYNYLMVRNVDGANVNAHAECMLKNVTSAKKDKEILDVFIDLLEENKQIQPILLNKLKNKKLDLLLNEDYTLPNLSK